MEAGTWPHLQILIMYLTAQWDAPALAETKHVPTSQHVLLHTYTIHKRAVVTPSTFVHCPHNQLHQVNAYTLVGSVCLFANSVCTTHVLEHSAR